MIDRVGRLSGEKLIRKLQCSIGSGKGKVTGMSDERNGSDGKNP